MGRAHASYEKAREHHTADRKAGDRKIASAQVSGPHLFAAHKPNGDPLIDLTIGMSPAVESNETLQTFLPRTLISLIFQRRF